MRKLWYLLAATLALAGAALAQPTPDAATWRPVDPESTLYIDTVHGRVVVEMFPEVAPAHVKRVKDLTRDKFYDGLTFHRVIDGFMAQTGDPAGDGTGASSKPDLPAEFQFRRGPEMPFIQAAFQGGARFGFYKSLPIVSQPDETMAITRDKKAAAWGLHCPGIASMARASEPNSANSQFFLLRAAYPSLDKNYTIWGRVIWNQEAVQKIAVGEPPPKPDRMLQVRVAADLPQAERAPIYIMRSESAEFRRLIERTRNDRGADFSVCDIQIPVRVPQDMQPERKERPWWRIIPILP